MQILTISLLLFTFGSSITSADERFQANDWFAGINEKLEHGANTVIHRSNENIIGVAIIKGKCYFLYFPKTEIMEQKMSYKIKGKEVDALGKEEFFDYEFQRGDSIFNFMLGNMIELPVQAEKVIYVARFSNSPDIAMRIECELDHEGKLISAITRVVDAKTEFPDAVEPS